MTTARLLFAVILVQQGLFGLLWIVAARLGLARGAAVHWAASSLLIAGAMGLYLMRGEASPWLTVAGANFTMLLAFMALRRGVRVFARRGTGDAEQAAVLALGAVGLGGAVAADAGMYPVVLVTSATMGWTLLRTAAEIVRHLGTEFGRAAAWACAASPGLVGVLLALRGVIAPFARETFAGAVDAGGTAVTGMVFACVVAGLLLTTSLVAMVVLRLVRRLQYQSDHDALTGVLARRAMERLLQSEWKRRQRGGAPFALLSVDIDHFKRINDVWGHAAGDAVLVRVARALRDAARGADHVGRMGGEEFCVLLPDTDLAGAEGAAQRLLEVVRALRHPELGADATVTVSIGLALVEGPSEPLASAQRRLDQALYAAKAHGRDRVERAAPPAAASPA